MSFQIEDLLGESSRGSQDADLVGAIMRAPQALQAKDNARLVARGVVKQSSQIGFIAQTTITGTGNTNPIAATGSAISAVTRTQLRRSPRPA